MGSRESQRTVATSRYLTDPNEWPVYITDNAKITTKTATGTSNNSGGTSFFTSSMTWMGAYTQLAANDTFYTICNVTGAGFLCSLVGASHFSSGVTSTFRITIDGIEHSIALPILDLKRHAIGCFRTGLAVTSSTNYSSPLPGSYGDSGLSTSRTNSCAEYFTELFLPTPNQCLVEGMPVIRFTSSVKVEHKLTTYSSISPNYYCGATYRLDS